MKLEVCGKHTETTAIVLLCSVLACVGSVQLSVAHAQSTRIAPAPRDAVPAVLDLFEQYAIVALDEGPHNNQKGHEFRLALVRDPRFGRLVNDVVVESGNSRYRKCVNTPA
jgi:hypothetical protein